MTKSQGKSWRELLQEHLENAPSFQQLLEDQRDWPMTPRKLGKSIHQILWDEADFAELETAIIGVDLATGPDHSMVVAGRRGKFPEGVQLIIIDECRPLLSEELYEFMRELGVKEKKPARPTKQPDWARHNQAPRSARRKR